MSVDRYTKIVLTMIAPALSTIALKPWFHPDVATAQSGVVDVNIEQVGGWVVSGGSGGDGIPVHVAD